MLFVLGVFLCRFVCVELKYQNFPLKWSQSCFQYLSVSSEATTCRLTCTKDRVTPHSLHIIYIYVKGYIYVYIYNHYWIFVSSTWNRKDKQTQLILTLQQKRENKKLCLLVWHIWSTSTAAEPKTLEWRGGGDYTIQFLCFEKGRRALWKEGSHCRQSSRDPLKRIWRISSRSIIMHAEHCRLKTTTQKHSSSLNTTSLCKTLTGPGGGNTFVWEEK